MKVDKTAAFEKAVDPPGRQWVSDEVNRNRDQIQARALTLLAQLDRIPYRGDVFDALAWDEKGLPR